MNKKFCDACEHEILESEYKYVVAKFPAKYNAFANDGKVPDFCDSCGEVLMTMRDKFISKKRK